MSIFAPILLEFEQSKQFTFLFIYYFMLNSDSNELNVIIKTMSTYNSLQIWKQYELYYENQ